MESNSQTNAGSTSKATVAAAPRRIVALADLQPGEQHTPVLVKILRKWLVFGKSGGKSPMSLELVLADAEGTVIQGHIDKKHIYIHEKQEHHKKLHEGHVYTISKFIVSPNIGEFRATRHDYRMDINYHTNIRPAARTNTIPDPDIIFTPPKECFKKEYNQDYLADVAGILIGLGAEHEFKRGKGTFSRMKIDLENRGYRFSMTLFGDYVNAVKELVSSGNADNAVLAFLWCKVDTWQGDIVLQTTMHTTRLLINPTIPETALLREAATQQINSPTLTLTQPSRCGAANEDFLLLDEKHTVAMVKELAELNSCVVLATIGCLMNEDKWWYWACNKCHHKAVPDCEMYYCETCNIHVLDVSKKLLLKLDIFDESGSITITVFDQLSRVLVGKSANDLYETWMEVVDRDYIPDELKGLEGREVLFKVQCDDTDGGRFSRQYRVRNLTDNTDITDSYKLKWVNHEAALDATDEVLLLANTPTVESGSVPKLSDNVSQDLIAKFDQSASDSSTVSRGRETVDITKDSDDTPPLKRKCPADQGSTTATVPLKAVKVEKNN